ncbi:MAG TPA: bifunctional phosphoglucose/phosphomannose isomerase [Candidatus Saccharimonadales bacterium]
MLDDNNVLKQRDPSDALDVAAKQYEQARFSVEVQSPDHDGREITRIVVAGMGGSALAALLAKSWLKHELTVPIEVVRSYTLPEYVDYNTLVIASSYSGNTEETLACLEQARTKFAQVAIMASGGALKDKAERDGIARVDIPTGIQPRMAMIYQLRGLVALLAHFGTLNYDRFGEIADTATWLEQETQNWLPTTTTDKNLAKQIALLSIGKTPVFYAGELMAPIGYKWKISWNESAKNMAFWNELPEFNHNEFLGWTSHPVEKPFAVFDLVSKFEHERVLKRFEVSDRLLSGKRPKSHVIDMPGDSVIAQMLWGCILADFASIYTGILNGVDPTPVALIEKLKKELG